LKLRYIALSDVKVREEEEEPNDNGAAASTGAEDMLCLPGQSVRRVVPAAKVMKKVDETQSMLNVIQVSHLFHAQGEGVFTGLGYL